MRDHILLGVSGSVAAFKAAQLAGELMREGLEVRVVLTAGASRFITPLTFEAVTHWPVAENMWDERAGALHAAHLDLAHWADLVCVAPASANTLARIALGLTDDLLGAITLSTAAPLVVAPAMESGMWEHPATQLHMQVLRDRGAEVVGPVEGRLASGDRGMGRMTEPPDIRAAVIRLLHQTSTLGGVRVLVTAGPTRERIDPIRFIGNRSSGRMGYAVAEEARSRGASVTLISGPTELPAPKVTTIGVETAEEMRDAVVERAPDNDVLVMAAAVSDFKPVQPSATKLRREDGLSLNLVATEDVALAAATAAPNALHVGFALETQDLIPSAQAKMVRKHQDLVVANQVSEAFDPMGAATNRVTLVDREGSIQLPEMLKVDVAKAIWDRIEVLLAGRDSKG